MLSTSSQGQLVFTLTAKRSDLACKISLIRLKPVFLKGQRTCQNAHTHHFFSSGVGIHLVSFCDCWVWIHSLPPKSLDSRTGEVTQYQTKSNEEGGRGVPGCTDLTSARSWNAFSPLASLLGLETSLSFCPSAPRVSSLAARPSAEILTSSGPTLPPVNWQLRYLTCPSHGMISRHK